MTRDTPAHASETLTGTEFWARYGRVEHERLDFKSSASYLKNVIPAMAMTDGGVSILGVSNDRQLTGCQLNQKTFDTVMRTATGCGVEVEVSELVVDGVELTLVTIPAVTGRVVTTTDGRLLHRVGSDCMPLLGDALARFVREREERPAEEAPLPELDLADIDLRLLNQALTADGRRTVRRESILRGLLALGVARRDGEGEIIPLRAAGLLFAHRPSKYCTGAVVQVVRRAGVTPGPGPATSRKELDGPISGLLTSVLDEMSNHVRRFQVVMGSHREEVPEYPTSVLREAILNALAHRDYGLSGSTVDITIWDDRMEIHSPGPLPGHITVDNMRDEHYSRNRLLMRVLKLLDLVEEYGEGVDRMITEMESRLMEPPHFAATSSSVTVTLYNRFIINVEDQVWLALLGHFDLSPAERRLLVLARHEGGVTPRRLRDVLGAANVRSILQGALAKGLVVQVGQAGGSRYVLSDEVVLRAGTTGLEARSRKRQLLLDEIRRNGSLSTAEAAALLEEDTTVARHMLNDLVRSGLAEARGKTRARRYHAL